ncbi:MAG: hypothetical protein N3C62_05970 [Synergistetes bacterium]|nr:hypothetical protein [Synergistota bacterium]MCX8128263.1 hypothetical protein [Synergistota bacterium]MDW8192710.1 hypothetical protein [Synergistota bacterium]
MAVENSELLSIIKELLEILVSELSAINRKIEKMEEEQLRIRSLLELLLDTKSARVSRTSSFATKISSLLGKDKTRSQQMEEYISFLMENPDKIPLAGLFKKPNPRKE